MYTYVYVHIYTKVITDLRSQLGLLGSHVRSTNTSKETIKYVTNARRSRSAFKKELWEREGN